MPIVSNLKEIAAVLEVLLLLSHSNWKKKQQIKQTKNYILFSKQKTIFFLFLVYRIKYSVEIICMQGVQKEMKRPDNVHRVNTHSVDFFIRGVYRQEIALH